jgi:hypothetical protein
MMPPEMRQQLVEYKESCEADLARLDAADVVAPGDREQLRELIQTIALLLELDAMEEVTE